MLIIKATKEDRYSSWVIKVIIEEIYKLMEEYHEIQMDNIYNEGNGMVGQLAKFEHNVTRLTKWEDINLVPSSTKLLMKHECNSNIDI